MERCDYKDCQNEATTKGYVLGRPSIETLKSEMFEVVACDLHKNEKGFFEAEEDKN